MKKKIKKKIVSQLRNSLKKSELTDLFYKRGQLDLSDSRIERAFNLITELPPINVGNTIIIPLGRLISLDSIDFDPDLNCFYFLVLEGDDCSLHIADLKRIKKITNIVRQPPLPENEKDRKLIYLLSCLQNHPDFIFEDIEEMNELL